MEDNKTGTKAGNDAESKWDAIQGIIFLLAVGFAFIWNWDGFWQTDIKPLTAFQQEYFSTKFKEEQLKVSRAINNNQVLDKFDEKMKKLNQELEASKTLNHSLTTELRRLEIEENNKCDYYLTSLRIINNLSRTISKDEQEEKVRCTNRECELILANSPEARAGCDI